MPHKPAPSAKVRDNMWRLVCAYDWTHSFMPSLGKQDPEIVLACENTLAVAAKHSKVRIKVEYPSHERPVQHISVTLRDNKGRRITRMLFAVEHPERAVAYAVGLVQSAQQFGVYFKTLTQQVLAENESDSA